jgi:hypothetical protein
MSDPNFSVTLTELQLNVHWNTVHPLRLKLVLESAQRTLAERAVQSVVADPFGRNSYEQPPRRNWRTTS